MPPKVTLPRTVDVTKLKASICRDSFWDFVRAFWTSVPGAGEPIWNWHTRYLCEELQAIGLRVFRGEPNDYDLVINIAPGTSKSMICSVLFQPWTWTFMPHARHVNASHTSELVLDLANKARDVIRSKKYQSYYPDVQLRTDMDAKGYYANTAGGMRFSCTVSGKTPTGFHGHFQCLPYSSLVTTEIGNIPIGDLVEKNIQTRVLSFNHETGKTEWNEIEDRGYSPGRSMCKVVLDDGNTLDCTTNHPVYVFGRGYINAIELKKGDKVCYEKGWNEQTFNVGASAVQEIKQIVWVPEKVYNLEVEKLHNYFASGILVHNSVDDPLDPQKALSEVELKTAENFMTQVLPSRKTDKAVSTTILIQQRVHHLDPTGVLLEIAKKEFSRKLRHVCLPAELTPDISPPLEELQKKYPEAYVEGLMDPVRMTKAVLQDFKSKMSSAGYEGQFLQKPVPPGGQMFRPEYFNLRVKSAPYNCTRIRYTDRASTPDGGCRTAMVLLAKDLEGNYYVEHVEVGQWEPRERNRRLRALALRDRARYPNNEPLYLIEREGGSSGRDAWLAVAKALEGFKFQEDTVTGDKTTRAEPWSSQLASGNVYIVDDGTWDVNDYIREHVLFPMHELKDLVDASSGAFNRLVGRTAQSTFRVLSGVEGPKGKPFLWSCTREELSNLTDDRSCLLVFVKDPLCDDIPGHALRALDTLTITTTDIQPKDYQDKWTEEIPKYGKKPEDLHFTREQAKKVWSFLMKRRSANATYYVFAGDSQDLVLSMSLGVAAGLGLKAKDSVHLQSRPDNKLEDVAPNQHVYEAMKSTRGAVM